jgi:hypothetical protein
MNRQQLVDQIAAIDRLIGELRERYRPIEREIALGHADRVPESERLKCAEHHDEVRSLIEQKRALRIQISEISSRRLADGCAGHDIQPMDSTNGAVIRK